MSSASPRSNAGPGQSRQPAELLKAAFLRMRDELTPMGWRLTKQSTPTIANKISTRLELHRDGVLVSSCGFSIGPEREVVFRRPAHRAVTGTTDAMGEADFHRLIATWANEVQAGIGHHWNYEATRRGKTVN